MGNGTNLGKAYVQIIPSAEGIKGKISNLIGGDVDSAGQTAGNSLGSKLVGTFSKVVAAAGIGQIINKSLNEGAALQQSMGGIETLFKDHADTVKKYASEAYITAGLSANDYMESVTSFSASLLQGLGGDTAKAAEIANMAMIDMSDNSAKFGSDMASIQMAYQGFAKQNYTMLDNLKLGYGGTKTEMERLLADAQKLTGVKYDINSLSDVYSAIHVIQDELGVTGTTAKESAATFSGSLASMKAAADNLLANLTLGEDVAPALQDLLSTTWTFAVDNLIPMVFNIIKGVKDVIVDTALKLISTDTSIVTSVMDSITAKLPELLQKGVEMVSNITNGILQNIPKVLESAGTILSKFVSFIMQNLPTILQSGVKMILSLVQGIINNLPTIISTATTVIANLLGTFAKNLPQLLQQGISMLAQVAAGLIQAIPQLIGKIPSIFSSVVSAFAKQDWLSIGANIISGVAKGILNGLGTIIDAAKEAALSAFKAAKNALGIKSPSKVMQTEVGKWIPEGIAVGIEKNASAVTDAMNEMTKEASGTINTDIAMGIGSSKFGELAVTGGNNASGGFQQNVNIYSPKELAPSEVARQTRNATRNMILTLQGA